MHRRLGKTDIAVFPIAFGAGPVPALLTGADRSRQRAVVERAIALGVNWFDTAPTYGDGASEESLGLALADISASGGVHIASKVRIQPQHWPRLRESVLDSLRASLARLRVPRLSLVQLHNAITAESGGQPSSVSPGQVLAPGGILDALEAARSDGLCEHIGLTGIGEVAALCEVIASGRIATVQTPFSLVQPSAGYSIAGEGIDDYCGLFAACDAADVGVLAIRVFAGGAIAGHPPSEHTKRTPYFPLDVYQRDRRRAESLQQHLPPGVSLVEAAVRFSVHHAGVTAAILGMATAEQVEEAVTHAARGPLPDIFLAELDGLLHAAS